MIRLAIAAPSAMLLARLEAMLGDDGTYIVVERAARLEELTESLEGAEVDAVIAVVDEAAPPSLTSVDDDGAQGGAPPRAPVVVLTDAERGATASDWLQRGARAVLPRDAEPREIHAAIAAVAAGLVVVPASDVAALGGDPMRAMARDANAIVSPIIPLSPREREILGLMAEGLVNKVIAARLGISEHTVKTHVASIFSKLDVETRAEAVAVGVRAGAISL